MIKWFDKIMATPSSFRMEKHHPALSLDKKALFCHLSAEELTELYSLLTIKTFKKGEVIFEENSPADALYIIEKGAVNIYKTTTNGTQFSLTSLHDNECFGELALLNEQTIT